MGVLCRDDITPSGLSERRAGAARPCTRGVNQKMARAILKNGTGARTNQASKYDANNTVLSKTYGALADLRRELADSKESVGEP